MAKRSKRPLQISHRVGLLLLHNGSQVDDETIVAATVWYECSTMVCMFSIGYLSTRLFIVSRQVSSSGAFHVGPSHTGETKFRRASLPDPIRGDLFRFFVGG